MTITIPTWVLWTLGCGVGGVLMALGILFLWLCWMGRNTDFRINW